MEVKKDKGIRYLYLIFYYLLGSLLIPILFTLPFNPRSYIEIDRSLGIYMFLCLPVHFFARELFRKLGVLNKKRLLPLEFLLCLSAVSIWFFHGILPFSAPRPNAIASSVQNVLITGIKECIIRDADNLTTNFNDVQSFSGKYRPFEYKIKSLNKDSCYSARAIPDSEFLTWFEIDMDEKTGIVSKTCGDSSKPGCGEGNTW